MSVSIIDTEDGRRIHLVGTAHISKESVRLVEKTICEVEPDCIAIELCESRREALRDPERWRKTDIFKVIKEGKWATLLAQLILASYQKRIGEKLDVKPGAEMRIALEEAEKRNIPIVLADRDIKITLRRTWAALGLWTSIKLFVSWIGSFIQKEDITEEDIEKLKESDSLDALINEFSETLPEVRESLIDERDKYLAEMIRRAEGQKIVAIVGAGHVPGIKRNFGKEIDLSELEFIPPKTKYSKIMSWVIPILLLGFLVLSAYGADASKILSIFWIWALITGAFASFGALLALGHPATIFTAFVCAPFTVLHPFLASGWIAAIVEVLINKPRVEDFDNAPNDLSSVRGLWKNRVTRAFLVMGFTNLFTMLGAIWGVKTIYSML